MYDNGRGVAQDEVKAAQWYRKAAEQGDAEAQFNLGVMCQCGRGVAQDETRGVQWYRKAAEQGHKGAQSALATLELEANIRKILQSYPRCDGFWVPPIPEKERAKFRAEIVKALGICTVQGGSAFLA
jgi:TPR repeat protein